jgi:hypothetical protein
MNGPSGPVAESVNALNQKIVELANPLSEINTAKLNAIHCWRQGKRLKRSFEIELEWIIEEEKTDDATIM